jgi:hypothetical protein
MNGSGNKDLYSILGVDSDASAEEIRNAYLARARVIHPDRFDRERQPQDWNKANEMLAELNEAYSILRDPSSREEYDQLRSVRQQRQPAPPPPPPFELGELTPGHTRYADLSKPVQERLRKRQQNENEDQLQVRLQSVVWNYVFIVILLCWFWYLFAHADGARWGSDALAWYIPVTCAVGLLVGRNFLTLTRWYKSSLKSYFYITPLYFIKTEFDIVSFFPIFTLEDFGATHNYKNGSYQNSDVRLKFKSHTESFTLSSKEIFEDLVSRLRRYDEQLRQAFAEQQFDYFQKNDDFYRVKRGIVPDKTILSTRARFGIYVAAVIACLIALAAANECNKEWSQTHWVRHETPRPPAIPASAPAAAERHWLPPEQPLPYNGQIQRYHLGESVAPFKVVTRNEGHHYFVKMSDWFTDRPVLTVFVRAGNTVEFDMPIGSYRMKYATGKTWYGENYLFGDQTCYNKADEQFDFSVVGNQATGYTVELYLQPHGNLHVSRITPSDW